MIKARLTAIKSLQKSVQLTQKTETAVYTHERFTYIVTYSANFERT